MISCIVGKLPMGLTALLSMCACWIMYDEFMSKFSRQEDGKLLYMGEAVR